MKKILPPAILLFISHFASSQALSIQGDSLINLSGGQLQLSKQGFPEQLLVPDTLLAENIHYHFTRATDGKEIRLAPNGVHFTKKEEGTTEWNAINTSDELKMEVDASLRPDGQLAYQVRVTALQELDLKEIAMHIPFRPDTKWDSTHTGVQYALRGASWKNEGRGGTTTGIKGKSMLVNNYSGPRHMNKGDILYYNFILLITPRLR